MHSVDTPNSIMKQILLRKLEEQPKIFERLTTKPAYNPQRFNNHVHSQGRNFRLLESIQRACKQHKELSQDCKVI
jgi:hypothetical protein